MRTASETRRPPGQFNLYSGNFCVYRVERMRHVILVFMNSVATPASTPIVASPSARLPHHNAMPDTLAPPASGSLTFTVPDAPSVTRSNSPEEVIDADVEIANTLLLNIHQVWGAVTTLAGVCKLAETTMTLLEKRRAMLLQPFGAPTSAKRAVIMPLE